MIDYLRYKSWIFMPGKWDQHEQTSDIWAWIFLNGCYEVLLGGDVYPACLIAIKHNAVSISLLHIESHSSYDNLTCNLYLSITLNAVTDISCMDSFFLSLPLLHCSLLLVDCSVFVTPSTMLILCFCLNPAQLKIFAFITFLSLLGLSLYFLAQLLLASLKPMHFM